jgi:chromosome segregation and condensation protein ScpB
MTQGRRVRSLAEAAAFVDRVGLAIVWGKADLVLPSLWHDVGGLGADWAVRDETGKAVEFTPQFRLLWRWKDELPEQRLTCAGRHFGSAAFLIAPRLLASAYALTGRPGTPDDFREDDLEPIESEVAEAVQENGPLTGPEIRRLLGVADRKAVDRAVARLQRRLVLTNAGAVEQAQGWRAIRHDLLARRWRRFVRRLPAEEEARRDLAAAVLAGVDELSAADLAGALGWRRKEAESTLAELVEAGRATERDEDGIRLYAPFSHSARA